MPRRTRRMRTNTPTVVAKGLRSLPSPGRSRALRCGSLRQCVSPTVVAEGVSALSPADASPRFKCRPRHQCRRNDRGRQLQARRAFAFPSPAVNGREGVDPFSGSESLGSVSAWLQPGVSVR
jgi:hypothetical protein